MKLTYAQYSDYHANKCKKCQGNKRILIDGIWIACGCQFNASVKWRYDQIQIYPEELKYKDWNDFCGISSKGTVLTDKSLVAGKSKALTYCFGKPNPELSKDRTSNSIVLDHIKDGQNIIISGTNGSGRSLLAALILKEVVYASAIKQRNIKFHWIKSVELTEAARWSTGKSNKEIDREKLDLWSESEFLFIDGFDLKADTGDHRAPPDITSLNLLFSHRLSSKLPTILVCSDKFFQASRKQPHIERIREQWGDDFLSLMNSDCVIIELTKAEKIG